MDTQETVEVYSADKNAQAYDPNLTAEQNEQRRKNSEQYAKEQEQLAARPGY